MNFFNRELNRVRQGLSIWNKRASSSVVRKRTWNLPAPTQSTTAPSSVRKSPLTKTSSNTAPKTSPFKKSLSSKSTKLSKSTKKVPQFKSPIPQHQKSKALPSWAIHKNAIKEKFPEGWSPRKKLSPDAMDGIRTLHAQRPDFSTSKIAKFFDVSPEAIRRILKSRWRPDSEEEAERTQRWKNRKRRILSARRGKEKFRADSMALRMLRYASSRGRGGRKVSDKPAWRGRGPQRKEEWRREDRERPREKPWKGAYQSSTSRDATSRPYKREERDTNSRRYKREERDPNPRRYKPAERDTNSWPRKRDERGNGSWRHKPAEGDNNSSPYKREERDTDSRRYKRAEQDTNSWPRKRTEPHKREGREVNNRWEKREAGIERT